MSRSGGITALVAFALVVAAIPARAQYRPPPPPSLPERPVDPEPAEADPEASPELEVPEEIAGGGGAGWGWYQYVALDGIWESNVGFTSPPAGGDFVGALTASVSRWRRSARSQWTTRLYGAGFGYGENSQLNRIDGGASTAAVKTFNPRTSAGIRGSYSYGHTDTDYALAIGGTVLPPSRMKTAEVGSSLSRRLGERTDLSLDAAWRDMQFESERLQDSTDVTANTTLARRLSTRNTLLLRLLYRRTEDRIVRHDEGATLGVRRLLTPTLALELSGGATRATGGAIEASETIPDWYFTGTAGLTGSIRRTQLVARYEHEVKPTVGYGVQEQTDQITLTATIPLSRATELVGTGAFAARGAPGRDDLPSRHDLDFYVGIATRVSRRIQIVAGYRFRRRDDRLSAEPVRNDRASVSIVWGPEALRAVR